MGTPYLLALDLGVASIGWALLELDEHDRPRGILRLGTHLFDAGSTESDFERGKDEPPAKPRRDARQLRKMIWRRARRKRKLLRLLQNARLLPAGDISNPAAIDRYMKALDLDLGGTWNVGISHREHQLLPYRLRAAGLDRDLSPTEFGRALYHLAQRRGFLSNRKSREKPDEKSAVKAGISELAQEMAAKGSRTLGEYFASIDPEQVKLRRRWTARKMYADEFDALWSRQAAPLGLSDDQRKEIYDAIFHQRPLKSSDHLIGRCRHLPRFRRAPIACRLFQRFRMLQKVNDLRLVDDLQNATRLTPEQRAAILDRLCQSETVRMTSLRKLIKAPKGQKFNFETEGEKILPGLKTDARLAKVIADYTDWPEAKRTALVDELLGELEDEAMKARLVAAYKLAPDVAAAVLDAGLEDAYAGLSREAMRRLLPRMETGENYMLVARELFPDEFRPAEPLDRLPPVLKTNPDLRNPTVLRGLTELRKLVNLIVKRYGKPQLIHIELLRDLKKSRDARADIAKKNDARRKARERAAGEIVRQTGVSRASARDIEKWMLAEECGWTCPYTGRPMNAHSLFVEPQFEIEHVWPYQSSLDDSFFNKTLCHLDANRAKSKRMPTQAFGELEMAEILARVARFSGDARDEKLRRFKATEIPEGFTNRQLTDSSYLARAASSYLGLLYGGINDAQGVKRVHTRVGGLTAQLRRLWGLNEILSGRDEKTRDDHRHHAIDAAVVGVADTRTVQDMMRIASEQIAWGRSRISDLPMPWPRFAHDLADAVEGIVVSHRQSRKVGGSFHEESFYSRPKRINGNERRTIHRQLTGGANLLKLSEVDRILDDRIQKAVRDALPRAKVSNQGISFPRDKAPVWEVNSRQQPVRRVTVRLKDITTMPIGADPAQTRHVKLASNHHARIIATLAPDGTEKTWRDDIVSRFEMYGRKSAGKLAVDKAVGPNERFKFSLAANEYVEIDDFDPDGKPVGRLLCRVLSVSEGEFEFIHHCDGRPAGERRKRGGGRIRGGGSWLRARNARKVFVNNLGEVKNAGG